MVFVNKTYVEMLKEIGFRGYARQESICPDRNPNLFDRFYDEFLSFGEEHVYPKLSYIQGILNQIPCSSRDREYLKQIIAEVGQNAFEWGHGRKGYLPISVEVARGKFGSVLRMGDSGKGHDYTSGSSQRGGTATKLMKLTDIEVAPEGNGSILNIMIRNKN